MADPIELLLDEKGKFSRTGLMFLVWMTFFMVLVGYVTFKTDKLADIPEPYVYVTLVLAGTYTARRFIENKWGNGTSSVSKLSTPTEVKPTEGGVSIP